jgi:hypothetical protein
VAGWRARPRDGGGERVPGANRCTNPCKTAHNRAQPRTTNRQKHTRCVPPPTHARKRPLVLTCAPFFEQVAQDLGDIQQAATPTAIVAAMSNLVKTLASAHREHFEGETCTVPTAQVKRLHAACTKATEFSQATLEEMDKAIAGLTRARELGRKALEEVASPGPSSA